jgi:hypothetical protein
VTKYPTIFLSFLLLCTIVLSQCANPVTPQGGPKDEKAPKVIQTDPSNFSTGFHQRTIRIDLDEFIALKNPASEIFISPPALKKPETRIRGKSLIIDLEDSLRANTTHSISFGLAITDITEGNILKNFNYVFSTGTWLDSMSLRGKVLSAFDLSPMKNIFVGLYIDEPDTLPFDSLPFRKAPFYLTRSNENGEFLFQNLRPDRGRIVALDDQNSDLFFSQLSEKVAFLDTLVSPAYTKIIRPDTTAGADSAGNAARNSDSLSTAKTSEASVSVTKPITLYMFEQPDTIQRLLGSSYPGTSKIQFRFKFPAEKLTVRSAYNDSLTSRAKLEYSARRDTINVWFSGTSPDTLSLIIENEQIPPDTIYFSREISEKKQKKGEQVIKTLKIESPLPGFGFNYFRSPLNLLWSFPIETAHTNRFILIEGEDTLNPGAEFTDSISRRMRINHDWKEGTSYKLIVPAGAVKSLAGEENDTLVLGFRTREAKEFGNLVLSLNLPAKNANYLIQLLNENEKIMFEQQSSSGKEILRFISLNPGKYKIKAILDQNGNGRWDPGNFFKFIQPETVSYLPKVIEIRANWDVEERWN